jgi:hypothetical protein
MKLDRSKPYGTIHGHTHAMFEQSGRLFDGAGSLLGDHSKEVPKQQDLKIPTDDLAAAAEFLKNILKSGPLSKAAVYKAAEQNNQPWPQVKSAFDDLKIVKFQYGNAETWKLPEEA